MGSGYWIAECMEAAGCAMVHGSKGGHSQVRVRVRVRVRVHGSKGGHSQVLASS